jgi:hypothetical protein
MGYPTAAAMIALSAAAHAQGAMSVGYGEGCEARRASFYEHWVPGAFDMNAPTGCTLGYTMVQHGTGWIVSPVQSPWRHPTTNSAPIVFGQDGMSAALPIGFTFAFASGESSSIWVHKDGYACFEASPQFAPGLPPAMRLLEGAPTIAAYWSAFDLYNCGSIRIDHDPVANAWTSITWNQMRETDSSNANHTSTFQTVIYADGTIDVIFANCNANTHAALSGWSPGHSAMQTGTTDLSALGTNTLLTFPDRNSMSLDSSDAARLGATVVLETSNLPDAVQFVFTAIGMTKHDPGIDLSALGVTGCKQLASYETGMMSMVRTNAAMLTLVVPFDVTLVGASAYMQSVGFDCNANAAGILLSNGFEFHVSH